VDQGEGETKKKTKKKERSSFNGEERHNTLLLDGLCF